MTTVGKFTASGLTATNENTFALLNINADFSLLKVEAPVEYLGLGTALSTRRRENAEHGPIHRTARRLGALFEQIIPPIKTLAEAYGKRVSEISASDRLKKEESVNRGPFASHVGFDGTSIYAAATSGHSAIAVHLLACMLARTWSSPEATALWVELVAERKRDIAENVDTTQIQGMAARIAAQQDILRAELAKWDASARAWLFSADEVKDREKTQLRLIVKDCGMLASAHGNTYASVLEVWTVAMTSLQKLILGIPQRISKAAILVGISAWHIYPNLNVVGPNADINFSDSLVANGGIITIGLQSATTGDDSGVQWSLSLSHLRHYGAPVPISTKGVLGDERISMSDLQMIALGSVLGRWGPQLSSMRAGAECLIALRDCYNDGAKVSLQERVPWLNFLCSIARRLLDTHHPTEVRNQHFLLSYGSRKARYFLDDAEKENFQSSLPFFGFLDEVQLAGCLTDASDERGDDETLIHRLREFAERSGMVDGEGIITYHQQAQADVSWIDNSWTPKLAVATAVRHLPHGLGSAAGSDAIHHRWIPEDWYLDDPERKSGEICVRFKAENLSPDSDSLDTNRDRHTLSWHDCPLAFSEVKAIDEPSRSRLILVAGSPLGVALYYTIEAQKRIFNAPTATRNRSQPSYDQVTDAFRSGQARPANIRATFDLYTDASTVFVAYRRMSLSLLDLEYASFVYSELPGATVSIRVVSTKLWRHQWSSVLTPRFRNPRFRNPRRRDIDFAMIATFETGTLNLKLSDTSMVMALASGNSIYVASSLLQDPAQPGYTFSRLLGSLDHPGTVLLVPPQDPMVRQLQQSSWRLVNHHAFDGRLENSFQDTTLHLSFTNYEIPISVSVGAVDAEASMVETLVSIHDRGEWVADIDVLGGLNKASIRFSSHRIINWRLDRGPCRSTASIEDIISRIMQHFSAKQLIAIDCWEELLDPPAGLGESCIAIVRAGDNWNARIAATCISVRKGYKTVVLPLTGQVCECLRSLESGLGCTGVIIL